MSTFSVFSMFRIQMKFTYWPAIMLKPTSKWLNLQFTIIYFYSLTFKQQPAFICLLHHSFIFY